MSAAGIEAGRAFVRIGAEDDEFDTKLASASNKLRKLGSDMATLGAPFAAIGGAISATMGFITSRFEHAGSELYDMSQRTSIAASQLDMLKFAAEQTGSSLSGVEIGIKKLSKALIAAKGGGDGAKVFNELGLSVEKLMSMQPVEQLQAIGDAVNRIENPAQRTAVAMKLFGKSGTELLPMLMELRTDSQWLREHGFGMTDEQAAMADELGDSFGRAEKGIQAVATAIGSALAPSLVAFSDAVVNYLGDAAQWIKAHEELVTWTFKLGTVLGVVGGIVLGFAGALGVASLASKLYAAACGVAAFASGALGVVNALLARGFWALAYSILAADVAAGNWANFTLSLVGIAAVGAAITKMASNYLDSADAIDELNAAMNRSKSAMAGVNAATPTNVAKPATVDAETMRRLHDAKIALIKDEDDKAVALIESRYDVELAKAEKANKSAETLLAIQETKSLEIEKVREDAANKRRDKEISNLAEIRGLEAQLIDDKEIQMYAAIDAEYGVKIRALEEEGRFEEAEHLKRIRGLKEELGLKKLETDEAQKRAEIEKKNDDERIQVEELRLRLQFQGLDLERALLDLKQKQALAAAAAAGIDQRLVNEEFELRRALLEKGAIKPAENNVKFSNVGATDPFAIRGIGIQAQDWERKTAEYMRDLLNEFRNATRRVKKIAFT